MTGTSTELPQIYSLNSWCMFVCTAWSSFTMKVDINLTYHTSSDLASSACQWNWSEHKRTCSITSCQHIHTSAHNQGFIQQLQVNVTHCKDTPTCNSSYLSHYTHTFRWNCHFTTWTSFNMVSSAWCCLCSGYKVQYCIITKYISTIKYLPVITLLLHTHTGLTDGSDVNQTDTLWKHEGDSATIECKHTKGAYYQMYWYRQLPGETMKQIVFTTLG